MQINIIHEYVFKIYYENVSTKLRDTLILLNSKGFLKIHNKIVDQ